MRQLTILLLTMLFLACKKDDNVQPNILVSIDIKGAHSLSYEVGKESHFGLGDTLSHTIIAKINDKVKVQITKLDAPVIMTISINAVVVDKIRLANNLTGYEVKAVLTEEYLRGSGVL